MHLTLLGAALAITSGFLPATSAIAETPFPLQTLSDLDPNRSKVWSHRTLGSQADENSVEGLQEVLRLGACGVEVDIYYDQAEHQLFVQSEEFNLDKRQSTLTLATLLAAAPPEASIWLDFWNLKDLDRVHAVKAIARLKAEAGGARSRHNIFVESQSATRLRGLSGPLWKILWIEIVPADDTAKGHRKHLAQLSRAVSDYHRSRATMISIDYRQYDATVAKAFANVPVALFTINDPDDLRKARSDPNVSIILSDKPFYSLTCRPAGLKAEGGEQHGIADDCYR